MTLPPEITVTIEKVGPHPDGGDQYLAVAARANGQEICRHAFGFRPDLLVDLEPQWLLDKAVPRHDGEALKRGPLDAARLEEQESKLAAYGQRLHRFLFDDGADLEAFLRFNDAYRRQARLTLALHANAAALWRLPWEYLHDGRDFLALHGRFLLARLPLGLGQLDPPPAPLPLRILVVISAPDDQNPLDTEEEVGVIQAALDDAVRAGRVQVEYLDDATLPALGEALRRFAPHVWHYTGHGVYDAAEGRSTLALENDAGQTRRAGLEELRPLLKAAPDLRLVLLSGCQTARTGDLDAFSGAATGLLNENVPAVLAMQASILDQSGIALAGAFYAALAEGETPTQAAQRARVALWQLDEGPGYDWGVPALYLRAQGMRLVDPTVGAQDLAPQRDAAIDVGGLPLPPHFVGRKPELRALRRALKDGRVVAAYVRGIGGLGKSSLAAKLLQRPGLTLDGALVIRCQEVDALDVPAKLARFLEAQGVAGHAEAAALLLDSRYPPEDRARQALRRLGGRRYVLVFDNFESLMNVAPPSTSPPQAGGTGGGFDVADAALAGLLRGLLGAPWRRLCLFTGRYRWRALDEFLGRGAALEIHLPALSARQAIMLMDNLPRLRKEPLATKIAVYRKVGGHPKSLELLEGWLAAGRVTGLLDDPALDGLLAGEWEEYFLGALLARLPPAEVEALGRLSIFRARLDEETLAYAGADAAAVGRWLDLSLLQRERIQTPDLAKELQALLALLPEAERHKLQRAETYSLHPVVGEYLLGRMTPEARGKMHAWAAVFYGQPFVEIARQAAARSGERWTEAQIEELARDRDGVAGQMVARTDDLPAARAAMARALAWQGHLFQAGDYEAASDIVTAVWAVLARWGERDRARALLRGSVETLESSNRAVAQGNLATLLKDEGQLDEALATYQEVYRTFEALGAKQQMAAVLNMQSQVLQNMGRYDEAIDKQEASLQMQQERGDEEGQAISLHQLAILYMLQGDYPAALARSRAAEKLARKLGIEAHVAATLHEQGLILDAMAGAAADGEEAAARRRAAFARFQESLAIKRRIGNEAGAADTLGELGKLLADAGQMREAIAAFNEALEIDQRLGRPAQVGIDLEFLGSVHERQGEYAAALEKYQQALALARQYSSPQDVAIVEKHIARVQARLP